MRLHERVLLSALILSLGTGRVVSAPARETGRSAARVLEELDVLALPAFEGGKAVDEASIQRHLAELRRVTERRNSLILELYGVAPDHHRIPGLMAERWSVRPYGLASASLHAEIDGVLEQTRDPKLRIEAAFARAYARLYDRQLGDPPDLSVVEAFLKLAPDDPRGAALMGLAARRTRDEAARNALEDRILKQYPDSLFARKVEGGRARGGLCGKTLKLEFRDAISGAPVSLAKLRGKVVVIEFWATWCAPCVAEIPRMKALYARYHDRGVEFLGVSLDRQEKRGGLQSLIKFVNENQIPWPQFYQGRGWESEFSVSCGIDAIPAVFVVDAEGKVCSTEARGELETLIPQLLKKRGSGSRGRTGRDP